MSFENVIINGLGIYHPSNEVSNEFFIEHFKKMDIDAEGYMKHLGREKRYLIDNEKENALTMALNSSQAALDDANLSAEALDMIVFVSETPEYTVPTNALLLNQFLGAKNAHIVYDMNGNCLGMLTALDTVSRYMKGSNVKRALVVGSLFISSTVRNDCVISYPNVADGSAAVILELKDEESQRGFIDAQYYTNSANYRSIVSPSCGYSKLRNEDLDKNSKKMSLVPYDISFFSDDMQNLVLRLLNKNNTKLDEIHHFLLSQFSKTSAETTMEKLGLGLDMHTFASEKYGYTGCASPFIALYEAIKNGKVRDNSKIVISSAGAGFSMCAVLYKF